MKKLFILMLLVALPLSAANVELNPTNHPDPTVDMCEFLGWNATDAKGVSFVGANLCYDASDTAAFFSDHGDCDNAGEVLQFDLATHVYSCGTLADADIPNTITIDLATLATTATTANAGDSATAFFSAGTIEHEYGGLEANLSAYNGLVDISGGTSSEVANLAELNTALGGAGIVTGAHFTPTAGVSTDHGAKAVALADLADGTDGELITWSAAGVAEAVAVGTATHVLTSNGVGLAPTFQAGAETNDLEATATSAGDAEIFVGTGVDTGAYITGLAACAADEKPEYVPGSPDTFTCEAIGGLVDADIEDTLTCSLYLPLAGGTMGGGLNMSTNDITMVSGQGIQAGGGFVWKIYDSTTPVNNLYINNADTGNAPAIGAEGSDAAVDLNLYSQGAGTIELKDATNVTGNLGVSGTVDGKDIGACLLNLAGLNTCVSSGLVTGAHTTDTFVTNKDTHDHDGGDGAEIPDAGVADTITASNYLLLAGGTLTAEVVVDDLGFEFTPGDTITDCTNFSATGGAIFFDDSEGVLKKCEDNVLTVLDTTGGTPATADISDVSVTQTELAELETIGATTMSANQWVAIGGMAETLGSAELDLLDGLTVLSGSNTGDQNLADTVAEISDLDNDAATLSLPASTTISAFGATVVDDANAAAARTTLGVDAAGTDNSTDVTLAGTPDYITLSGQVLTRTVLDVSDDTNLTAGTGAVLTGDALSVDHDAATNFVAAEHVDWAVRSMVWPAGALEVDGTGCTVPAAVALVTSGPTPEVVKCSDSDTATISGSTVMPPGWNAGTVIFELILGQIAASTAAYEMDFEGQCIGNDEPFLAFAGTGEQPAQITLTADDDALKDETAAVTLNGTTCAGGDVLVWRGAIDATASAASIETLAVVVAVRMEYSATSGD